MKESWRLPTGARFFRITASSYESEVRVVVDGGTFLDMAGHETGLRFRSLPTKMPFTMPMPTLTKKDLTMSGGRRQSRRVIELFSTDASVSLGSSSAGGRASQHDGGFGDSLRFEWPRGN